METGAISEEGVIGESVKGVYSNMWRQIATSGPANAPPPALWPGVPVLPTVGSKQPDRSCCNTNQFRAREQPQTAFRPGLADMAAHARRNRPQPGAEPGNSHEGRSQQAGADNRHRCRMTVSGQFRHPEGRRHGGQDHRPSATPALPSLPDGSCARSGSAPP